MKSEAHVHMKKLKAQFTEQKLSQIYQQKLKELDQVWKGYTHEETQTSSDVIEKRKLVRFGYLTHIQGAQVTERKLHISSRI